MSVSSNGLVTRPIGWNELAQLLKEINEIIAICSSDLINKWSRCKPISCPGVEPIDESTRKANTYGLKVPILSGTFDDCIREIINQTDKTKWEYIKPFGTWNSAYRITDFENYYHSASPPFPIATQNNYVLNIFNDSGSITVRFERRIDEAPEGLGFSSYNVRIEDIATSIGAGGYDLKNFKLAIAVVNTQSSTAGILRYESDKTLSEDGGYSVNIIRDVTHLLTVGLTYRCYPFFFYQENPSIFVVVPSDNSSFILQVHRVDSEVSDISIKLDGGFINNEPNVDVLLRNTSSRNMQLWECKLVFWKINNDGNRYDECNYIYNGIISIDGNGTTELIDGMGRWENGIKPTYDVENVTWMQFQSKVYSPSNLYGQTVNSEILECYKIN